MPARQPSTRGEGLWALAQAAKARQAGNAASWGARGSNPEPTN